MNGHTARILRKINLASTPSITDSQRRESYQALKRVWNGTPRNRRRAFLETIAEKAEVELRTAKQLAPNHSILLS